MNTEKNSKKFEIVWAANESHIIYHAGDRDVDGYDIHKTFAQAKSKLLSVLRYNRDTWKTAIAETNKLKKPIY